MSCAFEQVSHWLMDMSHSHPLAPKLDEEGICHLESESNIRITIIATKSSSHFRVNIDLMPIPDTNRLREGVFEAGLKLNLYQHRTLGGAVAIDPISQQVVLSFIREVDLTDLNQFNNILQNLIQAAKELRDELGTNSDHSGDKVEFEKLDLRTLA